MLAAPAPRVKELLTPTASAFVHSKVQLNPPEIDDELPMS
jgi:hypothetical protein